MKVCKYCNKKFDNGFKLGGHLIHCKLNPDKEKNELNSKIATKNIKHIIWNKGLTKENDERVFKNSIAIKKSLKNKKRKVWNKGLTKHTDIRLYDLSKRMSHRSFKHTDETKEKLSKIRSQILEEKGVGGFKNVKWYKIKNIKQQEFILRGTWEVKIANWLNENKILWIRKVYINYIDDIGIKRTYCPDFYLPLHDRYIEVKGYYSQLDKDKIKKVKEQNKIKLIILFGKHIKKLLD
jgi:hypothetical protein